MPSLPLGCLVVRTHFGDDEAWSRLKAALEQPDDSGYTATVTFVDDRAFDALSPERLKHQMPDDPNGPMVSFLADKRALTEDGWPLIAVWVTPAGVELDDSEYEPFRVVAARLPAVEANINLANLDWEDLTASADADGVFRGFE